MPLLWRYLLSHYLKVFTLCVCAFVALLLTLRLDEVAYFATMGPEATQVIWFALQQIPYVLPIAIPISSLISSVLLIQNLSQLKELTALRSCGFAIRDILAPVLVAAALLSTLNFYITSELSTTSHHTAGQLKNQLRSINPLLILNNRLLMRMKGFYFDTHGNSKLGEYAEDVVFLISNKHSDRMSLMVAKRLDISPEAMNGRLVTFLTSKQVKNTSSSHRENEQLVIESMLSNETSLQDFSQLLERKIWSINNDHLQLRQLLIRKNEAKQHMENVMQNSSALQEIKDSRHDYYRTLTEIARRVSASLAVFSFTLLGLSFGISISRNKSSKNIFIIVFFAAFYLVAFFTAKSFDQAINLALSLYLAPHFLIWVASMWNLRRVTKGVE